MLELRRWIVVESGYISRIRKVTPLYIAGPTLFQSAFGQITRVKATDLCLEADPEDSFASDAGSKMFYYFLRELILRLLTKIFQRTAITRKVWRPDHFDYQEFSGIAAMAIRLSQDLIFNLESDVVS